MVKNTCPVKRRPINNKCVEPNTFIKQNKQGFDCCYKIRKNNKNEYSLDKVKTFSYTSTADNKRASPIEVPKKKQSPLKEPKKKQSPLKEPKKKQSPPKEHVKKQSPPKEPKKKQSPLKEPKKKQSPPKEPKKKQLPLKEPVKKQSHPKEPKKKQSPPKEPRKKQSPSKEPIKKQSPPKKKQIHYNFANKLDKLLNDLDEEIEYRITKLKNKNYEYEERMVLELDALDSVSGSVDNIINILKTRFKTLKVVEKDDTMAILQYKKVYIGFHNKTYENNATTILFGCDITEEDISNWFSQEGRFEDNSYHNNNNVHDDDDDVHEYDIPASPYNPRKKLSKNFMNDFDKMLDKLKKNVDECIRDGVRDEYYEHDVFESSTTDPETVNINNLINLLKTKFSPLKIIDTKRNIAILKYKKVYIGVHTQKYKEGINDILFGCDATLEGIDNWFIQDGRF